MKDIAELTTADDDEVALVLGRLTPTARAATNAKKKQAALYMRAYRRKKRDIPRAYAAFQLAVKNGTLPLESLFDAIEFINKEIKRRTLA